METLAGICIRRYPSYQFGKASLQADDVGGKKAFAKYDHFNKVMSPEIVIMVMYA